jgi:chaperonin GroEL
MARLMSNTTETAVVDKPAEEEDHGHGHHSHAH